MKAMAAKLYGKRDLRLDTFDLRPIREDEVLAEVISDGVCMSSYKTLVQGKDRPGVPQDIDVNPVIIGHEFAARVAQVGERVRHLYNIGDKFAVQAAMVIDGAPVAPGYNFTEFGGNATHVIVPANVLTSEYIIPFDRMPYFMASLGEPYACILYALRSNYHFTPDKKGHAMGIKPGGAMAILAGAGPMGLGMAELALGMNPRPGVLVVTDIDPSRLAYAARVVSAERAEAAGVRLYYLNTAALPDPAAELKRLSGGQGFDDIYVMAPVAAVVEQADAIGAYDACINFFSGPTDKGFAAKTNYYDVHYKAKHIIGSAGSDVQDMRDALAMMEAGDIRPEVMVTHIAGLDRAVGVTANLPQAPGGKKMLYTGLQLPLCAIEDLGSMDDPLLRDLGEICARHDGLWCAEAEAHLLRHGTPILGEGRG